MLAELIKILTVDFFVCGQDNDLRTCVGKITIDKVISMRRVQSSHRGIDHNGKLVAGTQSQTPDDGNGKHLLLASGELTLEQNTTLIVS